jgi:esterase/lipase superfamily enzyme
LPRAQFWTEFARTLDAKSEHDALLFIHGYNTSFNEACRRAAQIGYDLKFDGPLLLYSWPSHDSWLSYAADEEMTEWTEEHFRRFLKDILERPSLRKLHVIAHSMGNRVLTRALFFGSLTSQQQSRLGQIILAAPDVNRLIFDEADLHKAHGDRITLYASDHDQALKAAKIFHQFSRLGYAHPDMYLRSGMDSIDASDVDTSLLGHSYISESRPVLADINALIFSNRDPGKRFGLLVEGKAPKQWWGLQP